jgi:hypothetical protein
MPTSYVNHFQFRHPKDSIHILNESPRPYDKCASCGIQLKVSDAKHRSSKACMDRAAMIRQRGLVEAARKAREVTFTIYGQTLRNVETFKYLGRPMSSADGDAAVLQDPGKGWSHNCSFWDVLQGDCTDGALI